MNIAGCILSVCCMMVWLVTTPAMGADKRLKVSIVSHATQGKKNADLQKLFEGMLSYLHNKNLAMQYSSIELVNVDYQTQCGLLENDVVASLTPLKYQDCNNALGGNKLRPLLSVKKARALDPYYSAAFIVNGKADIDSLASPKIKGLVLVDPNSASGYIAPLYKLWESGILASPTINAVKAKGWKVDIVGRATEVVSRVRRDHNVIGAVGTPSLVSVSQSDIVKLLHYYALPQDVVVVSDDLAEYGESIKDWFKSVLQTDSEGHFLAPGGSVLERSAAQVTGVVDFSDEQQNSIADLNRMRGRVQTGQSLTLPSDVNQITLDELVSLVTSLKIGVLVTVITAMVATISATFGLGFKVGQILSTAPPSTPAEANSASTV